MAFLLTRSVVWFNESNLIYTFGTSEIVIHEVEIGVVSAKVDMNVSAKTRFSYLLRE